MFINKVVRAGTAILMAAVILTAFPVGSTKEVSAAWRTANNFTVMDLNFDFNDMIMPVYRAFNDFGMDFFNVDFSDFKLEEDNNANLIQTAAIYVPVEFYEGLVTMQADDLTQFMKEAYDIELPQESVDMYMYNEEERTFTYPGSGGGFSVDCWKPTEFKSNSDGTVTAKVDLYIIGFTYNEYDALNENIKKPVELWDKGITRGRIVSAEISFRINEDYKYYPMQLISVKSEIYDWDKAVGTYTSEDGAFSLAFGMDSRYDYPPDFENRRLNILFTDHKKSKSYKLNANVMTNCAAIHSYNYTLDAFMSLNKDGTITLSDTVDAYGIDLTGKYEKTSDDVPPLSAKIDRDMRIIAGEELEETPGEYYTYGLYSVPVITGLGDEEFDKTVSDYIADSVIANAGEYESELNVFMTDITEEEDEEAKAEMRKLLDSYTYYSALSLIASSDFYYAIAEYTEEYRGGAHGAAHVRIFNIDTDKKQILKLDDVFKTGYKEALEEVLFEIAQTDEYKDILYDDIEKIEITEDTAFYLSDDSINILYPPYEIGPYAAGFVSFKILLSEIEDILHSEYLNGSFIRELSEQELFHNFLLNR